MSKPFDYMNAISFTKEDMFENETEAETEYVPFLVNRGLSYHVDCILAAQEMNLRAHMPKKNQFRYLNAVILKSKRYGKWGKPEASDISLVMEYYKCGRETARLYMTVLKPEDIADIKKKMNKEDEIAVTRGKAKGKA